MYRLWFLAFLAFLAFGCSREPEKAIPAAKDVGIEPDEVMHTIELVGFEPRGEPVIRVTRDGSLHLVFNLMPPSFVPDEQGLGVFSDFDKQLAHATETSVIWEQGKLS